MIPVSGTIKTIDNGRVVIELDLLLVSMMDCAGSLLLLNGCTSSVGLELAGRCVLNASGSSS